MSGRAPPVAWAQTLAVVAVLLAVGAGLAWWVGPQAAAAWLAVALVAYAAYHLLHLARLSGWLALPRQRPLPAGLGIWAHVLDRLARLARAESEASRSLAAELDRIHAAVDRLPDALIVLDRFDHVVWANRSAERLHGLWTVRLPIHHYLRQPEFVAYLESGGGAPGVALQLPSQPGRTYQVTLHEAADAQRLMVTRDVTDQLRLDAMRRDFVANASHEIRTPLTVIGGFVETMLDLPLDDDARRGYLQTILQQTRTMRQLVEDLLTLSTLEHAGMAPGDKPVALAPLLAALVDEARALSAGRHEIALEFDGPPQVRVAAAELQSAVRNLLTNAIRYTPEGGRIRVRWSLDHGEGRIEVRDTGIGIAPEHLPRLTERFYRVDRARSRDTGGTGLGLAIVKHVLQRHQAQLQIRSTPGVGSTFTIRLPAARVLSDRDRVGQPSGTAALDAQAAGSRPG